GRDLLLLRAHGDAFAAYRRVLRRPRHRIAERRCDAVGAARQRVPGAPVLGLARRPNRRLADTALEFAGPGHGVDRLPADPGRDRIVRGVRGLWTRLRRVVAGLRARDPQFLSGEGGELAGADGLLRGFPRNGGGRLGRGGPLASLRVFTTSVLPLH